MYRILTFITIFGFHTIALAQTTDQEKLENQKYYQTFIKDNISYMRDYVDSTNIKLMLNQMDQINDKIGSELEKIQLPPVEEEMEEMVSDSIGTVMDEDISMDDMETAEEDVNLGENSTSERISDLFGDANNEDAESPLDKFLPGRKSNAKRTKTYFMINYGLNFIHNHNNPGVDPIAKTWSSWFWEYGFQTKLRLGNQSSKTYFLYGLTYLKNRFTWDNDVKLSLVNDNPVWNEVERLKDSPKFRVGYLTVPLGVRFKLAKKTHLDLGGHIGYRLFTSQTHVYKLDEETLYEKRRGAYEMNDWVYGATAALKIFNTRLLFKYNFSNLFKENPSYNTNLFMVGFQGVI
jgi:hypothetical protein